MSESNSQKRLEAGILQAHQAVERLRDAASLTGLAMQEFAMAVDDDLKESLDDAARCLIRRASGS